MKKLKILVILALLMLLNGCSLLGEVNDSIDYVNTATTHIEKLNAFAKEAPQLIQNAVTNPDAKQELEAQLLTLKQDTEEFISINDVPSIAETIHQELVNKNKVLLDELNRILVNGHLALDQLENSQLLSTMNEVTNLLNRINNLVP
jgi:PBP1b-binding outer membrane lipoprotein LpoB